MDSWKAGNRSSIYRQGGSHTDTNTKSRHYENVVRPNLVPRPPPRLYLAAVEKSRGKAVDTFLHGCEIKSGWRPGYEVSKT